MLLCVTATSMAAVVACTPSPQPVGTVGRPDHYPDPEIEAGAPEAADGGDTRDAAVLVTADPKPDAGALVTADPKRAPDAGAARPPAFHPDRVGTTATLNDDFAPTVGTTAHVPDKKK
ncbi:hypothetical protein BH09MYX1_BH09MYX1_37420 [soil metagenome]